MKVKYLSTICLSLILILGTVFGVATAADAQEVHALLIILGNDRKIKESVAKNEEKMVNMLKQLSHHCNVHLTLMYSMSSHEGTVSEKTFVNGRSKKPTTQEQDIIESRQVAEWLRNLRPKPQDTVLIYYSGHGEIDSFGTHELIFDPGVKADTPDRTKLSQQLKEKPARLRMLITDTCSSLSRDLPESAFKTLAGVRGRKRQNYSNDLFLKHEGFLDITAASPGEFAIAHDDLGGHFTSALLSHGFTAIADTNNDDFLSWQETFEKTKAQTKVLYGRAEFDDQIAEDLRENRQTTQEPVTYSLPTRIGGGGGSVPPQTPMIGATLQNADNAFDDAETTAVRDDDPEKMEKNRLKQQELYDKAMQLYSEVIERDTKGKYAQRAHYQIAKIYKRRYDWDKANEHYQAIVALDPTGYYANEAKSGTANIRKNLEVIKKKRTEYQNYKAIYDSEPTDETFNIAAEALYKVARAYENLENYTESIRHYERLVEEFPEHAKAPQAQFQMGNVYFYALYDYPGGWPAFVGVTHKFPDSYEAPQAKTLLKQTIEILTEINFLMDEIDKYRNKKAVEYQKTGRKITPADMWVMGYSDQVVQNFQQIAGNWEKLRNFPRAIKAYKTLARDLSHKKFAVADALYRIGALYQQNSEYERAIEAYDNLFENAPESVWRNKAVYQQAVCYRSIHEFGSAYEGFKAYMSITKGDTPYLREVKQIVRQYELDQDEDGYKFYEEQEAGTSDQDANSHPGISD